MKVLKVTTRIHILRLIEEIVCRRLCALTDAMIVPLIRIVSQAEKREG